MKGANWVKLTAIVLALAGSTLQGQNVPLEPFFDETKPVKRAEAVVRPPVQTPAPTPAATPTAEPVVAPVRVATPIPIATPLPHFRSNRGTTPVEGVRTVKATPPPKATPLPKATPMAQPSLSDPTGEIRITPQGTMRPDQLQLSIADGFYLRKVYDQSAAEYEKYLDLFPNTPERPNVLYRLAESYRANGTVNAAKSVYDRLLGETPTGELIGPACYRLAELYYQEKNFSAALPLYRRAAVRLKDPKLVNSAKFFTGRSLEALGQKLEARQSYEELIKSADENPFFDASRLSLAILLKDAGRIPDALKQIQALAKDTQNEELKAQATVYGGLWELEIEQLTKAEELLKKSLQLPAIGRWRDIAQLGLLQVYFNDKKYAQVIESYEASVKEVAPEIRPQILNLVAMAQRQLGKTAEAVALFDQLIKEFPTAPSAKDAAYERLACLYSAGDPNLVAAIDQYLLENAESSKRDQVLLMKAELLFKKADFGGAAGIYALLENSRTLPALLKAEAISKLGWSFMQEKEYERAIKAYTGLIEGYPQSKAVPAALVQRGLARLRLNQFPGALKDFDELATRFPKAGERELALQQKALVQGQINDNVGMAKTFKLLLKDYPKTSAAAEANYWIGWVAFENKEYKGAPEPLEAARSLDHEQYFEKASLRILLSYFYLEDKEALAREIDIYSNGGAKRPVPAEVIHWIGQGYYEMGTVADQPEVRVANYRKAAKYLQMLTARDEAKPMDFLNLGRSQLNLAEFKKAAAALEKYLATTTEPAPRVTGLLALGQAQLGLKTPDAAQKSVNEALSLQPDGELNAKARVLAGDIQMGRGNFAEAARVYESVGVVIDDENITPQALAKAIEAHKANRNETDAKRLLNTLQSRYPEYLPKLRAKQ